MRNFTKPIQQVFHDTMREMGTKEEIPELENNKELSTLTLHDLQDLADKSLITLETTDFETYTGVWAKRTARMSKYEWRKLTYHLKKIGFAHLGGGNEWYSSIKDNNWSGLYNKPLGVAIETTTEQRILLDSN